MRDALLIAGAVLALASAARAQSCGADDDGGSDSSSSSSDSSYDGGSSDDSSAAIETPPCVDTTDVVGHTECRRFGGGWSNPLPPLRFTLFASARRALVGHLAFRGSARHFEDNYAFANTGRGLHSSDLLAGGGGVRIDLGLFDYLSLGVEIDAAGAGVSGDARIEGGVRHVPRSISLLGLGGVLGVAIPLDDLTLRGEVFVGARAVVLQSETQVEACIEGSSASAVEAVIEPRLALEWFFDPWLSLSAFVGTQVLVGGELHGGLAITAHVRSFDAQPGR